MKALVMSDAHIVKDKKNEKYWCRTAVHGYDFWKRYLDVFDEINVVARVQLLESIDESVYTIAEGPGVQFTELPFIRGTKGYIVNYFNLKTLMKKIITNEDVGIFRVPSLPTFMLLDEFKKTGRPYALEVIVDPKDAYRSNKLATMILTKKLKKECLLANGVSYVTQFFLEKEYPSYSIKNSESEKYFDAYYSSIKLETNFFGLPKCYADIANRPIKIIHIASAINSDIKGHTTLLKIIAALKDKNVNVELRCIGDGDRRKYYEDLSKQFGINDCVKFLGLFSDKQDLRNELLQSDLFVFPSQAEGLPRVLIEAMATGLPCLSTPVNGIPELLEDENLFDPFDVEGFVNRIINLKNNPAELEKMSRRNVYKAYEYEDSILQKRRNEFYNRLKVLA